MRTFPNLHLHSIISGAYRQEVEELFFFNPKQDLVRERVREHVERYGTPAISQQGTALTLKLDQIDGAQTLFVMVGSLAQELVGVLIYVREGDCLRVLYLALKPDYTEDWRRSCPLISGLVASMKEVGRRVQGLKTIRFALSEKDLIFDLDR